MVKKTLSRIYIGLILLFLYAPIFVLIILSFNSSRSRVVWGGFTMKWYQALFSNSMILEALGTTIVLALSSAFFATLIGVLGALGIDAMRRQNYKITMFFTNIPLINADIVTGIALMLWFVKFLPLGFSSVLIAHITFNIPYIILCVLPRLRQMDTSLYEAARDLGANGVTAFFKITLPFILPGILSGFFMAVTMSMDDFVITYFTKGAGVNTLSTMIYGEIRKGIKPEMYALSSLLFFIILLLLILINLLPKFSGEGKYQGKKKKAYSKISPVFKMIPAGAMITVLIIVYVVHHNPKETLTIMNYGEYIDPDVITMFEEETGIKIHYEEATTPEDLYTKYTSGAISYDLLCSSDYMIQRLINEGEAKKIDFSSMKYSQNISDKFWTLSQAYDPGNEYSLPYFWGTIGILYDTTKVHGDIDSWEVLFNGEYKNDFIMQNSLRDTFMITLKYLGYSLNTDNETEIYEAKELLIKQKPDVQAYLVDEARDEVVAGNAAMAVVYSGEAYLGHEYNENLEYAVPKEGSEIWIDSWIITKNCQNTENAQKFLDFLCREDIAALNFEYIYYSTPNQAVIDNFDEELKENEAILPSNETLSSCEVCVQANDKITRLYSELWKEIKAK